MREKAMTLWEVGRGGGGNRIEGNGGPMSTQYWKGKVINLGYRRNVITII